MRDVAGILASQAAERIAHSPKPFPPAAAYPSQQIEPQPVLAVPPPPLTRLCEETAVSQGTNGSTAVHHSADSSSAVKISWLVDSLTSFLGCGAAQKGREVAAAPSADALRQKSTEEALRRRAEVAEDKAHRQGIALAEQRHTFEREMTDVKRKLEADAERRLAQERERWQQVIESKRKEMETLSQQQSSRLEGMKQEAHRQRSAFERELTDLKRKVEADAERRLAQERDRCYAIEARRKESDALLQQQALRLEAMRVKVSIAIDS